MKRLYLLLILLVISPAAYADYYVWKDAETGISASFPDTWKMDLNQLPDTVLTIVGPDHETVPVCRLRVRRDGRFKLYPVQFESDVQKVAYSREFWENYLLEQYNDVKMTGSYDQSGLGRSFASHTLFNFIGEPVTAEQFRQGVGFASHYYDRVFIAECTANHPGYTEWVPHFMNFFKSIDYKKVYNEYLPGHYREFIKKDATEE